MQDESEIVFPPFRLDLRAENLWRKDEAIPLRAKTFFMLRYLAEHPGRLVSKRELLRVIWGEIQVSEEGLRDYIREIRQALQDNAAAPRFVETVRGRGYRFIGEVVSRGKTKADGLAAREEDRRLTEVRPLLTIRGVYDGKTFRALPTESVPPVSREVAIAILFLEEAPIATEPLANELLFDPLWQPEATTNGTASFNGLKNER